MLSPLPPTPASTAYLSCGSDGDEDDLAIAAAEAELQFRGPVPMRPLVPALPLAQLPGVAKTPVSSQALSKAAAGPASLTRQHSPAESSPAQPLRAVSPELATDAAASVLQQPPISPSGYYGPLADGAVLLDAGTAFAPIRPTEPRFLRGSPLDTSPRLEPLDSLDGSGYSSSLALFAHLAPPSLGRGAQLPQLQGGITHPPWRSLFAVNFGGIDGGDAGHVQAMAATPFPAGEGGIRIADCTPSTTADAQPPASALTSGSGGSPAGSPVLASGRDSDRSAGASPAKATQLRSPLGDAAQLSLPRAVPQQTVRSRLSCAPIS